METRRRFLQGTGFVTLGAMLPGFQAFMPALRASKAPWDGIVINPEITPNNIWLLDQHFEMVQNGKIPYTYAVMTRAAALACKKLRAKYPKTNYVILDNARPALPRVMVWRNGGVEIGPAEGPNPLTDCGPSMTYCPKGHKQVPKGNLGITRTSRVGRTI